MNSFREDLKRAVDYHGHLCSGQVLGVRMARMGLRLLGIDDPLAFRDLIVYVETDRCIADAVGTVTGCKIGRRRLKWMDYGKTAVSFLNLQDGQAVRIYREKLIYPADGEDLVEFYEALSDEELFIAQPIEIPIRPEDMPGKPIMAATCEICGEEVIDGRHIQVDGHIFCKGCHGGHYYRVKGVTDNVGTL
ncbi:formylmethanofuran dehydrogenase subunit E [Hydrogenoanaerobacterium saccharovorans]|uniref:Formylmethanofuran dehydrogenase, subunit E n=1 Tax=Hydrogenoanaerobacterium saccharovorans TaxID=474960 RepID=A0A1H8DF50_9FIRM|nr:FmdE family protein [Hydrogenoanaerobacterium saccharovorans]RPF42175.1 formylmethanofuran dehydrogenase subunit E [Hydrogenoanaerobacterium saccharovorans]SEN05806.1 formylmethanofuran dehydrogenase, subunit E [Hydrogenoanaerobacterium saccharovorans]